MSRGEPREAVREFWPDQAPGNFVGGDWRSVDQLYEVDDPSTGLPLSAVPSTCPAEVDAAIEVAAAAQPEWAAATLSERAAVIRGLVEPLRAWGERLSALEAADTGNPLSATRRDVNLALRYLTEWPGRVLAAAGRCDVPHRDGLSLVLTVPYGVVGRIIAYNHPSLFALAGSLHALLAGNAVVVKAAEQTPLASLALGRIVTDALPAGVFNVVAGGAHAGDALVVSPHVKRIAFTGSDRTALRIQARLSASGIVKHLTTELGGKNPTLVFPDVELAAVADAVVAGASLTVSAGQSCQATARVLVHEDLHDRLRDEVTRRLAALRVGVAYHPDTQMGPLISAAHRERVLGIVEDAVAQGAECWRGELSSDLPPGGHYLAPILLTGVHAGMRVATEEVFGPVLTFETFADEEEAIRRANDTAYGLSAAVWTRSIDRGLRVANALQAGYVWVNDANRHYGGSPFGGMRNSGTGREESLEEYASYGEPKAINIRVPGLLGGQP